MRNCNPHSPKADNPLYTCNHATGRWNKVRHAPPPPVHGLTVTVLRQLARESGIRGYSRMTKAMLIQALSGGGHAPAKSNFAVLCKEMERECPMPESLEAEPWCDHRAEDVFYLRDGRHTYCHTATEIYKMIEDKIPLWQALSHGARAALPVCPYTRRILPMRLLDELVERIRSHAVAPPADDRVRAFLRLRRRLYEAASYDQANHRMEANGLRVQRSNRIMEILNEVLYRDRLRNRPRNVVAFITNG